MKNVSTEFKGELSNEFEYYQNKMNKNNNEANNNN